MSSFVTPSDYNLVAGIARAATGVLHGMDEILTACHARLPHSVWHELAGLEFDDDVNMLREWVARLLDQEAIPEHVDGLYFGLAEYADAGRDGTICRFTLVGGSGFDPADQDCQWVLQPTYSPSSGLADSSVLTAIYRQVQQAGGDVAALGQYMLGLGYGCLAVRTICDELRTQLLDQVAWRGVAVGFDCGDAILLGRLEPTGWLAPES
jgi:hypothetical protein